MEDEFSEFRLVNEESPLRQGDVLARRDESGDAWSQLGIVVTADCDIANSKNRGLVTCVPVVDIETYLLGLFVPRVCQNLRSEILDKLAEVTANWTSFRPSRDRIPTWIDEVGSSEVVRELRIPTEHVEVYTEMCDVVKSLGEDAGHSLQHYLNLIASANLILGNGKTKEKARRAAESTVRFHLKSLPGDCQFLNSVSKSHSGGYVAYLRRLDQLEESRVALRPRDISEETTHTRLARIEDRFIHALTQKLGSVFGSIGMPAAYEDARDRSFLRFFEECSA